MKIRILAICLLICLLFTGCGAAQEVAVTTTPTTIPYDPEDEGPTSPVIPEPDPTAPVGAILQVPDAAAHPDSLNQYDQYLLDIIDAFGLHYTYAYRYTFATDEKEYYIMDEYNAEETVWCIQRDEQEQYVRDFLDSEFTRYTSWYTDPSGTQLEEFDATMEIFFEFYAPQENTHYVKMADVEAPTGTACAYEVYIDNKLDSYILIDKASGILVQKFDEEMNLMLLVMELNLSEARFPDYK